MRAQKIHESISFKRGQNPHKALGIGDYNFMHGDKYIDKNNNILTYDKALDEFWYEKGTIKYVETKFVYDNLNTIFTKINESLNFKRGQNPHDALNIGPSFKDPESYVKKMLLNKLPPFEWAPHNYTAQDFFNDVNHSWVDYDKEDLYDEMMLILNTTSLENQKKWWDKQNQFFNV